MEAYIYKDHLWKTRGGLYFILPLLILGHQGLLDSWALL